MSLSYTFAANGLRATSAKSDHPLSQLSPGTLHSFNRIKHSSCLPAGAILFVEGQHGHGIFLLRQGRAKFTASSNDGKTIILRIAEEGEFLGLHASITGTPHATTVETMQPCDLEYVNAKDFSDFLKAHSDAAFHVAQILSFECSEAYELARNIGLSSSVAERLARILLEATADGKSKNGKVTAKFSMTHEEVSQLVGSSRETISRLFSEFKKKDLVELKGANLTILNRPALEGIMRATRSESATHGGPSQLR